MAKPIKKPIPPNAVFSNAKNKFWQRRYFNQLIIFLFAFLLFANSIPNDYNLDDELVTINHRLTSKGIVAIPEIFTSPYYQDASGYSYEYRPVVLASFALEHQFFGESAFVSHFFNVALYGLACILLFQILNSLFKNYSILLSFGITFLFVAHPAHTEVVCSIKNRDEILGLLFSFSAFFIAIKTVLLDRKWLLFFVSIFFVLALLSKNTMIPFVVIIPIALILLTECDFITIIGSTLALLIPTFVFISFNSNSNKVILSLGLLILIVGLYCVINFSKLLTLITSLPKKIFNRENDLMSNHNFPKASFSFNEILPDRSLLFSPYLILIVILTSTYYWGLYNKHLILVGSFSFLLLVLILWGENKIAYWSKIMLNCCIACTYLVYGRNWHEQNVLPYEVLYNCILFIYAFYQFAFRTPQSTIPSLVFLLFIIFDGVYNKNVSVVFLTILGILTLTISTSKNKIWIVGICIWLIGILSNVVECFFTKYLPTPYFFDNSLKLFIDPIWSAFILLSFTFKKGNKYIVSLYAFLVLVLFNMDHLGYNSPINYRMATSRMIVSSNNVNLNVISNTQVRPLNYVEECIDINTPLAIKMGTSLQIIGNYFCKVIFPYPLSFYYGYKFIQPQKITETIPLVSLILHFCLLFISLFFLKKDPPLSFGLFIYLISVIAFSNFLIPLPGMFADRFLLLPSLGWVIVLGIILYKIGNFSIDSPLSWKATAAPAKFIFLTIMIGYSLLTFSRNMDWKNYLTLFRKDINYVSNSSQAHNLLAIRLMKTSFDTNIESEQMALRQEGLQHFKEAVRIYPNFFNANYDLARTYLLLNQPDSAVGFLKKTVELDSNFTDASVILGDLLFQRNRLEEAKSYYEIVVKLQPNLFTGYEKLGVVYYNQKNFAKAIEITKVAVEKMPNNPQPYISLAKIYNAASKRDSTQLWLKKALLIAPGNGEAQSLLDNLKK